jgi:hypothetical protein
MLRGRVRIEPRGQRFRARECRDRWRFPLCLPRVPRMAAVVSSPPYGGGPADPAHVPESQCRGSPQRPVPTDLSAVPSAARVSAFRRLAPSGPIPADLHSLTFWPCVSRTPRSGAVAQAGHRRAHAPVVLRGRAPGGPPICSAEWPACEAQRPTRSPPGRDCPAAWPYRIHRVLEQVANSTTCNELLPFSPPFPQRDGEGVTDASPS